MRIIGTGGVSRGLTRGFRPHGMLLLTAAALALFAVSALPVAAHVKRVAHPYRLVVPGTFGGPSNYLQEPGIPYTSKGVLIGFADTSTRDRAYDKCPSNFCDGYRQHAFAWHAGKLTDLGVLPGFTGSFIGQLNNHGVGVGGVENGLNPNPLAAAGRAVLFEHGKVVSLGTLPRGSSAFAVSVDNRGQVAGISNNGKADRCSFLGGKTQTRGFVWRDGLMRDLGTLGGPDTLMNWQNARGQIIGQSYTTHKPDPANNGCPGFAPFLWQHGKMINLGSLGGTLGSANWINDAGEVVGLSNLAGDKNAHPFLWRDGKMTALRTPRGYFGLANYISNGGDTAGFYFAKGHAHALLWRGRRMVKLPTIGDATNASGNAVNNRGQVVGNEDDSHFNEIIASLWARGHGYDLNALVAPTSFQMVSADYIDSHGNIVGHGVYTSGPKKGDARMFLLLRNRSVALPSASTRRQPAPAAALTDERQLGYLTLRTRTSGAVAPAGITNPLRQRW
ncbi:MAG: hypothetical protein ACTHQQ_02400 [Solirubrobacteraceae bacterium]